MSEQNAHVRPSGEADLDHQLAAFIASLAQAGYARKTRRDKVRLIKPFIQWSQVAGIAPSDIDEGCIDSFLACPTRRRYKHRCALQDFLAYLRSIDVLRPRTAEPLPAQALCQSYIDHLRTQQGLSTHSIAAYSVGARGFIDAMHLPVEAERVDAPAIRRYLLDYSRDHAVSSVKLQAAALRSFLRFCLLKGTITRDLSLAVPPVGRWQPKPMPPVLSAEAIERVLAMADRSTIRGCRDFAILQLLARLGLRASEILALRLEDLRWEAGEILIRGKGGQVACLPLPREVGEAIADYLLTARGKHDSRAVFLRHRAPYVELQDPGNVSGMARRALARAGLLPSGRVGAHLFRYSLATRMIRRGASLIEIAQILRHRSIRTTEGYTKLDLENLRSVARSWPDAEVTP
ncbi:MAG: integrase [Gammaproteobacteria bacterium]|nr:integrase [Gammaproteobacteria bacterium]